MRATEAPSGREALAKRRRCPVPEDRDLLRVSQYVGAVLGEAALDEYLHSTFDADYPPTPLHAFLAELPEWLRSHGAPPP